jgi:hypothetical protein
MIATRMLTFKLVLASELMSTHPEIVREHADLFAQITEPMRAEEATVAGAIRLEMFFGASFAWDLASSDNSPLLADLGEGVFAKLLEIAAPVALVGGYKPQATLNDYVAVMLNFAAAADAPPARFAAEFEAANKANGAARQFRLRDVFFNPLGRLFLRTFSEPHFATYTYRLRDAVTLSRLVELQRRLIQGAVPAADVAAAAAASAAELGDLYSGEPARWDADAGMLSLESRGKRFMRDGRIAVSYRP